MFYGKPKSGSKEDIRSFSEELVDSIIAALGKGDNEKQS